MLDPRLYRLALLPVLLAVLVTAFSLENRPRPIGTTLAPDAFDAARAERLLDQLAAEFPRRRAGDADDARLARRVAGELRAALAGDGRLGPVEVQRFTGTTPDGERDLVNVIATRPGQPGRGLVVVAHRDAVGDGAKAELSGTATMLELARVAGSGRLRRSVTFVSTTAGAVGAAGAAAVARRLKSSSGEIGAVIVLGDVVGARVRRPFVVPWSNGRGQAPLRLRRTVEAAVREEAGTDPGGARAGAQWARLAFPLTVGEQGAFGRAGLPAVLLQVSGERGPAPADRVVAGRLGVFGRAALRALYALDNGPDVPAGPQAVVVTRRKVLPAWAVRLLVGALLLPPLVVVVDALARLRRRREPLARWFVWTLGGALPFALAAAFLVALAATGLVSGAPPGPVAGAALDPQVAALTSAVLVTILGWVGVRTVLLRRLGATGPPVAPGAAVAVLTCACVGAVVAWVTNPYAAALAVPALHLWLLALAPELRMPRVLALILVLVPLSLPAIVLAAHVDVLGPGVVDAASAALSLVGGGHVSVLAWLLFAVALGCVVGAVLVALFVGRAGPTDTPAITVRGPASYAGPGSLGGVDSALRR